MTEPAEPRAYQPPTPQTEPQPYQTAPPPPPAVMTDPRGKSAFLASLLSLMPGLGQVYIGYYQRGFIHVIVAAVIISLLAAESLGPLTPLGGIFLAFFWLYNVVDAGRRATLYNQALAGGSSIELPEDFQVPGFRGSLIGGLSLAAVGVILLLNTRFDVSLAWIEEWWPAALILFGAYLTYKAIQDKSATSTSSSSDEV